MAASIERHATSYLEPSRRGGHLWLFFDPILGADARRFGDQLLSSWGLQDDVELFPKQSKLKTGPGSAVRLPLGIHRKSGERYRFVTLDEALLAPTIREQIAMLAHPDKVSRSFIDCVLSSVAETTTPTPRLPEGHGASLIDKLKGQVSVADFVSQFIQLDKRGRAHCPFHHDEHKSFSVNLEEDYWHCFAGCGGGSVVHFWARMREANGDDPGYAATIQDLKDMLL